MSRMGASHCIYINIRQSPCAARRQFLLGFFNIAARHLRDTFYIETRFHHFRRKLRAEQGGRDAAVCATFARHSIFTIEMQRFMIGSGHHLEAARGIRLHDLHCDDDESTICVGKASANKRMANAAEVSSRLRFSTVVPSLAAGFPRKLHQFQTSATPTTLDILNYETGALFGYQLRCSSLSPIRSSVLKFRFNSHCQRTRTGACFEHQHQIHMHPFTKQKTCKTDTHARGRPWSGQLSGAIPCTRRGGRCRHLV